MSRLTETFIHKPVFMPYFPVGYPDYATSLDIIETLANNGADIIEIGMSFSDPLADGPVIQKATQIALENGVTVKKTLSAITTLRERGITIPFILMGYYNPILSYGLENFVTDARSAGVDGFIIPDLPPEEASEFTTFTDGLPLICMLAPTTSDERMEMVARNAKGFIYLVSVNGVTGSRSSIPEGIDEMIKKVRKHTLIPVCIGFGISNPDQAKSMSQIADGVIVGSACVQSINDGKSPLLGVKAFAQSFKKSLMANHTNDKTSQ